MKALGIILFSFIGLSIGTFGFALAETAAKGSSPGTEANTNKEPRGVSPEGQGTLSAHHQAGDGQLVGPDMKACQDGAEACRHSYSDTRGFGTDACLGSSADVFLEACRRGSGKAPEAEAPANQGAEMPNEH